MRTRSLILVSASLSSVLLAACTATSGVSQNPPDNPLYAEWYYEDLVDHIVSLELASDDSLRDADAKKSADEARAAGLKAAGEAEEKQNKGLHGTLAEVKEPVTGEVLIIDGALYFSPDFVSVPGVELHAYLSTAIDPRESRFPGEDDIDAGVLASPYGAQALPVPADLPDIRSVVLWDKALKRVHAFAQVRRAIP